MTEKYKPEHLAKEADRLLADPILALAIENARKEALDKLTRAKADDITEISKWQQRVQSLDEIPKHLKRFIIALGDTE